jgi:hypothetical protein
MASATIVFAIALILLGAAGYFGTAMRFADALLPAVYGVAMLALGLLARRDGARRAAIQLAAVVALVGFLASFSGLTRLPKLMAGESVELPILVLHRSVMAAITGIFILLCVKWWISGRKRLAS